MVIVSALVAHTAWHWMLKRMSDLRFVNWPWPGSAQPSPAWLLIAAGLLVLISAALWWLVRRLPLRSLQRRF